MERKLIATGMMGKAAVAIYEGMRGFLSVGGNNLTTLKSVVPVDQVYCADNNLTRLELLEGVEYLCCEHNNLTNLNLPRSLQRLSCDVGLVDIESDRIQKLEIVDIYYD